MEIVPTYQATIFVGLKERHTGFHHPYYRVRDVCQAYCDEVGLCITITETEFIYTNGRENGAIVGLINYPRFPSTPEKIRAHAIELGNRLLSAFNQYRLSIVFPSDTVMMTNPNLAEMEWEAYHVNGCTCRLTTILPDGQWLLGGVDDCPIHGFN